MLNVHVKNNQVLSFNGDLSSEIPHTTSTVLSESAALSGTKTLPITLVSCARLGVGQDGEVDTFSILPNPCNSCVVTGVFNEADLSVTDVVGRMVPVKFIRLSNGYSFSLPEEYEVGVYLK